MSEKNNYYDYDELVERYEQDNLYDYEIIDSKGEISHFKAKPNNHTRELNRKTTLNLFKTAKLTGSVYNQKHHDEKYIFDNGELINKYWLRCLYGFSLHDIQHFKDLESAKNGFEKAKSQLITANKKTPFMIFLVDAENDDVIKEFTLEPTKDN